MRFACFLGKACFLFLIQSDKLKFQGLSTGLRDQKGDNATGYAWLSVMRKILANAAMICMVAAVGM